jgi:hypothetical protein
VERVDEGRPEGDLEPAGELRFAYDPSLRGQDLFDVPVQRMSCGPLVEERYRLENGRVRFEVVDLDSGFGLSGVL